MKTVSVIFLRKPNKNIRFAVMKKTPFGLLDVCSYHESIGAAWEATLDLPRYEYEIVRVDQG